MKPSDFQNAIRLQFDCLVKRVIDTTIKDYNRETFRRVKHEVDFTDLPKNVLENMSTEDRCDIEFDCFEVMGICVKTFNKKLSLAMKRLPEMKLNILLMFYFLDMSDSEISKFMNVNRTTVFRNRKKSLEELKKIMEENNEINI